MKLKIGLLLLILDFFLFVCDIKTHYLSHSPVSGMIAETRLLFQNTIIDMDLITLKFNEKASKCS